MPRDLLVKRPKDLLEGKKRPVDLLAGKSIKKEPKFTGSKSFAFGGLPGYGLSPNSEDILPLASNVALSGLPGGTVFGGVPGQVVRQGIRKLKGKDTSNAMTEVAMEPVYGAAGKILFGSLPKFYFRNQVGNALKEKVGGEIGEMATKLKKVPTQVNPSDVIGTLEAGVGANPYERGASISAINSIKSKLGAGTTGNLPFESARQLEQQIGREAQYAGTSGHFGTSPKAPGLNRSLQDIRSMVSEGVDEAATKAGVPAFGTKSKEYASLSKKFPTKKLKEGFKLFPTIGKIALAGGIPVAGGNPLLGALSALSAVPQSARTAVYNKVAPVATKVAQPTRLAVQELLRSMTNRRG